MITDKEYVLNTLRQFGIKKSLEIQEKAIDAPDEYLISQQDFILDFNTAKENRNMNLRDINFICKSSAGRIVKLLQPYDSDIYPQEPEELPAQWGFVWSTDPKYALPFIAISTSPYNIDKVCIGVDNKIYKSLIDNNIWEPASYPAGWEEII